MSKATLFDNRIKKYAYCKPPEIYRDLGTSVLGLSKEQVDAMRERYGKNSFQERKTDTTIQRLRRAFINPFHVILFILGIVSLVTDVFMASNFTRNATTALIIFSMIVISGIIRLIQELRAKSTAAQLDRLIHEKVTVRRNGELREIPGEELVVGDLVLFSAGDCVPADIRLTKVTDLFISQAAITGESAILEKSCRTLCYKEQEPITQLENLVFMATTVISGKGEGIVLAVGTDTLYGGFTKPDSEDKNAFQKGANSIAWVMIRFMAVLVPIVFLILGITGGKWLESFAFALSVAVGLMPEMLPMVITACLAKGSLAMGKKQTIIKDLNAMQSFGSMDVLCMDKTGTLTNESILLEYYMDILGNENTEVLDLAYLNSSYHSGVCNPIDNAILACKSMPGREIHYAKLLTEYQMEKDARQSVFCVVGEMLQDGMKVIAVARKRVGRRKEITPDDERDMTLVGYLSFFDAPKQTAGESVTARKRLKVIPKILTGDQADIALSVCRRVGISAEHILTGTQLDEMTDCELKKVVEETHVFAELTPGQKVRLVSALKENGHTVGFLGDGVNDIPALNEANVGISVDTAVDATKDALSGSGIMDFYVPAANTKNSLYAGIFSDAKNIFQSSGLRKCRKY